MKFYSEKTKKFYDTAEACQEAETDYEVEMIERRKKAEAEKKKLEQKLEEKKRRRQEVLDAYNEYHKLAEAYSKDYDEEASAFLLFEKLFNW